MKKSIFKRAQHLVTFIIINFWTTALTAQDSAGTKTSTSTTSISTTSQVQPWMWILGGAIVVIILIALLSSRKSDTTVTRTTIYKDNA